MDQPLARIHRRSTVPTIKVLAVEQRLRFSGIHNTRRESKETCKNNTRINHRRFFHKTEPSVPRGERYTSMHENSHVEKERCKKQDVPTHFALRNLQPGQPVWKYPKVGGWTYHPNYHNSTKKTSTRRSLASGFHQFSITATDPQRFRNGSDQATAWTKPPNSSYPWASWVRNRFARE